jgi:hypothetical protein
MKVTVGDRRETGDPIVRRERTWRIDRRETNAVATAATP